MSKELEALESIGNIIIDEMIWQGNHDFKQLRETKRYKLIEQALKRNEPMKVIEIEDKHYLCPNCDETINIDDTRQYNKTFNVYCRYCGQALDWSNENE